MKHIAFEHADGIVEVLVLNEGRRLVNSITLADGTFAEAVDAPFPADELMRTWPIEGAKADWAETEDQFIDRVRRKDVPKGLKSIVIDRKDLPSDEHRAAWRIGAKGITIDISAAKEAHRNNIRRKREVLMAELDTTFLRAIEAGDTKQQAEIAKRKQALRDATADPAIDAAKNPAELSALFQAFLKKA